MPRRDVAVRLDRETIREVDAALERARANRPGAIVSRADFVNQIVARGLRDRRMLRALGAA